MKLYIFADLEGISGVAGLPYVSKGAEQAEFLAEGRRLMTEEINNCVEGCFRAGATELTVRDGHGNGFNVFRRDIDSRADLVQGSTGNIRMGGLDGADGLILLGYHAMAGTQGALLEHTYSSKDIQNVWLNGRKIGEIGLDGLIAAEHGVKLIMVTGDDKACAEAADFFPEAVTCEVKKSYSCSGAKLISPAQSRELIIEGVTQAVRKMPSMELAPKVSPVVLQVEVTERGRVPKHSCCRLIDARTYQVESDTVEKAFFLAM